MLMHGAITTYLRVTWIVVDIIGESGSPQWRCRGKLWLVCLRARDHGIHREKSSFKGWGKLTLLLIDQFPCWWLEDISRPWRKLPVGNVRGRIDFSYFPVVRTLYNWNLIFVTGPRPAKHIFWRCVDIWQSSYPKDKVCVWRATGQKSLKCLPSRAATTISFKDSCRITPCLC